MGDARSHPTQVRKTVLASEFLVLDLQLIRQASHSLAQRAVGLLESVCRRVPGIEHNF